MLEVVGVVVEPLVDDRWVQQVSLLSRKARDTSYFVHRHLQILESTVRSFEAFQYPMEREFRLLKFLRSNRLQAITSCWRL